jgi:purine-cytosine permease-like protein
MNETQKTSSFSQALLWFGAAVSIAEILTGALLAPLGLAKGFLAILLGHVIGCTVFYFAGLIGAKSGLSAIETTRLSF